MIIISGSTASAVVYNDNISDTARDQLQRICNHPMFDSAVIRVMPDCHAGKGCVIGFTSVSSEKIIVPALVGNDIGCGVLSTVFRAENLPELHSVDEFIRTNIPSGIDVRETPYEHIRDEKIHRENITHICSVIHKEDKSGHFLNSIGTLGNGNHFIEIDHIADDRYVLAVHTGSRSLGNSIYRYFQSKGSVIDERRKSQLIEMHRTASSPEEHIRITEQIKALPKLMPDEAYITGELFDSYIDCMMRAKEYAAENRRCISHEIMNYIGSCINIHIEESFDTVHNYVDWYDDDHTAVIIRKGAVSAEKGQKLCIPLNMRDGIIIARGNGNDEWNRSAPHGAGRAMSRSYARSKLTLEEYSSSMKGISTWSVNEGTIDEAPQAYKPSEEIIGNITETVDIECIAKTVYNFKAE